MKKLNPTRALSNLWDTVTRKTPEEKRERLITKMEKRDKKEACLTPAEIYGGLYKTPWFQGYTKYEKDRFKTVIHAYISPYESSPDQDVVLVDQHSYAKAIKLAIAAIYKEHKAKASGKMLKNIAQAVASSVFNQASRMSDKEVSENALRFISTSSNEQDYEQFTEIRDEWRYMP